MHENKDDLDNDEYSKNDATCDPDSTLPCRCPTRSYPDPPQKLPFPAIPENREKLEKYILEWGAAGPFNTCTKQPMPETAGPPMHIFTKPNAVPLCIRKPRPVPIHWRELVKSGLDADVRRGVIEKVPLDTPDTWCSPMVIRPKKNGKIRRTIDLSALTKASIRETHHTRSPNKVVCSVPAKTLKTTLDCADGYHGVPLAKEDRHKTTFITEYGRFRYCRCPQGHGSSNDGYTKRTDQILEECPRCQGQPTQQDYEKIVDDILVWSTDLETAFFRITTLLAHCHRNGMVFHKSKFNFAKPEVQFAGFVVGWDSIRPTPEYMDAILAFPRPNNISEVRSWFGLINQVAYCFSKGRAMQPFRHLLSSKEQFEWTDELTEAFNQSKEEIVKLVEKGVATFDPTKPTCLRPDWSKAGIGWILQQKTCSCRDLSPTCCPSGWALVLAGGRFCSKAESNYAPTEGEALAVVVALEQARYYTLGCPTLLVLTDHKPLVGIFNNKELGAIENPKLQKLKERSMWWKFTVHYTPGDKQFAADAISRRKIPVYLISADENDDVELLYDAQQKLHQVQETEVTATVLATSTPPVITWDVLEKETYSDEVLQSLKRQILSGFPPNQTDLPTELKPYFKFRLGLHLIEDIIAYKERIVIPENLRTRILQILHSGHSGVSSMINRAEQSIFWPGITNDIAQIRYSCLTCIKNAPSLAAGTPNAPPEPQYPFQSIVCDFFALNGHNYLVIADRFSGWISVFYIDKNDFDSSSLASKLREYFHTFNVPEELSSDGGPQLTASPVQNLLKHYGINHRLSSAYFPHSNMRAELAVKTSKRLIRDNTDSRGSLNTDAFVRAILQLRNTPHADTQLSPAQMVFGRQLRDFLPVIPYKYRPRQEWSLLASHREQAVATRMQLDGARLAQGSKHHLPLPLGSRVAIQNQTGRFPKKWDKVGTVIENKSHDQVLVLVDGSRRITLRNRRFLKPILHSVNPPNSSVGLMVDHTPSKPPVIVKPNVPVISPEHDLSPSPIPVSSFPSKEPPDVQEVSHEDSENDDTIANPTTEQIGNETDERISPKLRKVRKIPREVWITAKDVKNVDGQSTGGHIK